MPTTQRPPKNKPDLIIIGGGASGLAAACVAADAGLDTLLLEKEERVGRKLLATGNGRCNLMNFGEPAYWGDSAFARSVLTACGAEEVARFFEGLGLVIRREADGRAYPASGQAACVLDCLRARLENSQSVKVRASCTVREIWRRGEGFSIRTQGGETFEADRLIVSAGGPAAPKLGGSESLAAELAGLGHRLVPFRPALSALMTDTAPVKGLSGLRVPACLTLFRDARPVSASAGEMLFTEYGISGVCAMQLSREAGEGLDAGAAMEVSLDFSALAGLAAPLMRRVRIEETDAKAAYHKMLDFLRRREGRLVAARLYTGLLPRMMAQKVQSLSLQKAAQWLTALRLRVTGVRGFDAAQVSSGGLSCSDFDPGTLQSRLVPGLYVTGETLNVDGDCGGYNLLFAWATGLLAAGHAVQEAGKSRP